MSQPITIETQRELIDRLKKLAARRTTESAQIEERAAARIAQSFAEFQEHRDQAITSFQRLHAALVAEYRAAREKTLTQYESAGHALAVEEEQIFARAADELSETIASLKAMRQHRTKEILRAYKEQKARPKAEFLRFKQQAEAAGGEVTALLARGQDLVRRRGRWPDEAIPTPPAPPGLSRQQHMADYSAAMRLAIERLTTMQNLLAARFVEEGWPLLLFLFALPVTGIASWLLMRGYWVAIAMTTLLASVLLALGSRQAAVPLVWRQTQRLIPDFQRAIMEARVHLAAAIEAAKGAAELARRQVAQKRDADLAAVKAEYKQGRREHKAKHQAQTAKVEESFSARRKSIEERHERQLDELEDKYPRQIEKAEQDFLRRAEELRAAFDQQRGEAAQAREREQQELLAEWDTGLADFERAVGQMNEVCDRYTPAWQTIDPEKLPNAVGGSTVSSNGQPAASGAAAIRLGQFEFDISGADDQRQHHRLPAAISYPDSPSLLLEAEGEGRDAATRVIQNVMLRLLTTFPPGKVRFTIIDPVGLGQNFSAFMHLADYDEKLVNNRIWTEANHINQRLADLTEHMENVIQKYLRNEYASIEQYNQHAGEVAEPFQILVIANFPANFSEEAARRLASIASSGARCGVYTLISTDAKLTLPRNFALADLEAQAATLEWDSEQRGFRWKDDSLKQLALTLEEPPDENRVTAIIRNVGKLAKDAARVEVPFQMVTPKDDLWWTLDSRGGIDVPLGRAGAKNLQYLRLGKGTSQHVLISGKTGSGKSTLLNALITNVALHYSPSEVEFYLIDFKKGVEFKAYAVHRLPHARVIAIESEREFGMSVLERLDQELKTRGDLFRKEGVQDLKGYRAALESTGKMPVPPMPRILLIIDEFQEFFTSDDRIAHDAALLLDRLVRQGRAFGIHVLLGSQTLAGAYSLARSTLGQMAVRIALQCSETDAHLILSEDNSAARLLSRPGEAIYNDANGLFEGNHPFQTVWLSDDEREHYLERLAEASQLQQMSVPPPIVFEGNAASDPTENILLRAVIESPSPPPRSSALRAWLGSAVAIKDPTDAIFRPQSGGNLLIVGQQEELALGILATSVISLAAQRTPDGSAGRLAGTFILDGTRADAPDAGYWKRVCSHSGLQAPVVTPSAVNQTINDISDEVSRRVASGEEGSDQIFLVIYNLSRFRDLKKGDDFSFGGEDGTAAGKKLATILRDGPPVGIHTLVWCDSYSNLNRWVDRQALRDFEMRVIFQMSASDSSNLMDSPAASKLGTHAALFYSEERGQAEKFRPYGLPAKHWLAEVAAHLSARAENEALKSKA